jgi:hypothetical protein
LFARLREGDGFDWFVAVVGLVEFEPFDVVDLEFEASGYGHHFAQVVADHIAANGL